MREEEKEKERENYIVIKKNRNLVKMKTKLFIKYQTFLLRRRISCPCRNCVEDTGETVAIRNSSFRTGILSHILVDMQGCEIQYGDSSNCIVRYIAGRAGCRRQKRWWSVGAWRTDVDLFLAGIYEYARVETLRE